MKNIAKMNRSGFCDFRNLGVVAGSVSPQHCYIRLYSFHGRRRTYSMPRANTTHAATMGARRRAAKKAKPRELNRTAAPEYRGRKSKLRDGSAPPSLAPANSVEDEEEGLGETVLLLENRFFRPGGIRVGTLEQMMFRPGLAPDHHSPPPAFRRTTRQTVIPYSKGRPYRKEIGVSKLAETNSDKREDTRLKLVGMLGGNAEVARAQKYALEKMAQYL